MRSPPWLGRTFDFQFPYGQESGRTNSDLWDVCESTEDRMPNGPANLHDKDELTSANCPLTRINLKWSVCKESPLSSLKPGYVWKVVCGCWNTDASQTGSNKSSHTQKNWGGFCWSHIFQCLHLPTEPSLAAAYKLMCSDLFLQPLLHFYPR